MDGELFTSSLIPKKEELAGLMGAALSGALTSTGISAAGLAIANATIDTTVYLAECEITGRSVNKLELAASVGVGVISDVRGSGGIDGKRLRGVWNSANQKLKTAKSSKK